MSTVPYSDFLPDVLPYVVGVPEPVAVEAVRNACIEFCQRSNYYRYEVDEITPTVGEGRYDLSLPTDTQINQVLEVWYDGQRLLAQSDKQLSSMYSTDWREVEGTPGFYTMLDQHELVLVPKPDTQIVDALKVIVALKPSRDSIRVFDDLWEHHYETIACGAKARLTAMPGLPAYDMRVSAEHYRTFRNRISDAIRDVNKGHTTGTLAVRPRAVI